MCVNPYCPGTGIYHFPSINELAAGFEPGDDSITSGKNTVFLQLDFMYKPLE
jgi:hypothetical protein